MDPRQHRVGVVPLERLQPVHVLERIVVEQRRVRIPGHVFMHAGIDVQPGKRLKVRLRVQRVASAQTVRHPAPADVEGLALDPLMRPCRHRIPVFIAQPHFHRGIGQGQQPRADHRPTPATCWDHSIRR